MVPRAVSQGGGGGGAARLITYGSTFVKTGAHCIMSLTWLLEVWFQSVFVSNRMHNQATPDIFLMAVKQIVYTLNCSAIRSTRRLVLPRTPSKPACRAAKMAPVNASGNNVVFFEHLFLGVSDVALMFKCICISSRPIRERECVVNALRMVLACHQSLSLSCTSQSRSP